MKVRITEKEKEEITEILTRCNDADGTGYSAPLDADGYYLSKSGGKTVSFLAFYELGETVEGCRVDELCAFTDPAFRKKGRMRKLRKKLGSDRDGAAETVFKFQAFPSEKTASYLLKTGCTHVYDELLMTKRIAPEGSVSPPFGAETELHFENEHSELWVNLWENTAYLYDVRTDASHLREGSAEKLIRKALQELSGRAETALLQVSSQNTPALRLYEKTGFSVAETLEMWYDKLVTD